MTMRQKLFGLSTGGGAALLGAMLAPLDPVGWHLIVVGLGLGALTAAGALLQLKPVAVRQTSEQAS